MSNEYTFSIDKGIPVEKGKSQRVYYPFAEMEVGDSFFVPQEITRVENVRCAASYFNKRHNIKFKVVRFWHPKGCRVWRTQ